MAEAVVPKHHIGHSRLVVDGVCTALLLGNLVEVRLPCCFDGLPITGE
jgi:hypothetical protein